MINFSIQLEEVIYERLVFLHGGRYSYLRASIGDSLEARLAGAAPNISPTAVETPKARITELIVTFAGK